MRRIRCCRILGRAPISRSRTAWRWRRSWRRRTRPRFRRLSLRTSGCAASAWRRFSSAPASTGCAWIRPPAISASATGSSPRTPNSESSFTATTWFPSFRQAGLPGHLAHALELLADLRRELLRPGVALNNAERGQPRGDGRRLARLLDRVHEGLPRSFGNARGREKAEPDAEQLLAIAQFPQRRYVRKLGDAVRRGDAAERSGFYVCAQGAERQHYALYLPAAQGGDRRGRAGIWDAEQVRARKSVDQLHAEIADGTHAGMTDAHLARILLRVVDELREAFIRRVASHDQHARRARRQAERRQIAQRIVRSRLGIEHDAKGEGAVLREEKRLAVFLRLDDACRRHRTASARAIDRDHRRIQPFRDLLAHDARRHVRRIARRERNDDIDRSIGKRLCQDTRWQADKRDGDENVVYDALHGLDIPVRETAIVTRKFCSDMTTGNHYGAVGLCRT